MGPGSEERNMGQMGFFDIANRYVGLDAKNDPFVKPTFPR